MPLDAQCNPTLVRTAPAHTNACLYAKLGLAVWRARPEALLAYDDWFFETFARTRVPPPLPEAFKRAADLVGDLARFDAALKDPWVDRQLQTSIRIYETNFRQFRSGSMPQFILGTNILTGTLTTPQLTAVIVKSVAGDPARKR
jgi:hypothetical protein